MKLPHPRHPLILLLVATLCACQSTPAPSPAESRPTQPPSAAASPADPHAAALERDPEAMPESTRQALKDFRDRFACNNISGCPSERVLLQAGWTVRPLVQQLFEKAADQATYRSRSVRVVAELQDPAGRAFLRDRLEDSDPDTRAYALYGLGLLHDPELPRLLTTIGRDDATAWMAPVRLTGLWILHREGDAQAERDFQRQLAVLARQQMAMSGLVWGLTLCMRADAPDCSPVLPLVARHTNFQVRRLVARAMSATSLPSYAAALVDLAADSARSIHEPAIQGLQMLSGQSQPPQGTWRKWCEATSCQQAADAAILALDATLAVK